MLYGSTQSYALNLPSVGMLMTNSGIEDILKRMFAGVPKMLSGKNFPSNVRALRLLAEEILRNYIADMTNHQQMVDYLHVSTKSRTAKHWVENMIKPAFPMIKFVRAERGDWPLHLYACAQMLPYFLAGGHTNYAPII